LLQQALPALTIWLLLAVAVVEILVAVVLVDSELVLDYLLLLEQNIQLL
jgi:hypothetical protein